MKAHTPGPLLYVGTADGLHILQGDAARHEWHRVGHALAGHDISAFAEDAAGSLLVGTAAGRLFHSADTGACWSEVGAGLSGQKIWSIVPDPCRSPGAFYAGLGGGHLFRSDDGGRSWHELTGLRALPDAEAWWGPFGEAIFHSILLVADRPGKLYAGLSVVGVLASDDGGATWRDTTAEIPRMSHDLIVNGPRLADIHKLALHPRDSMRLYATTHYGTFRSDDGAASWQNIGAGLPFEMTRPLALHPHDPDTIYVICHEDTPDAYLPIIRGQLTVHRSRDGGRTWQSLSSGLPEQVSCSVLRDAFIADASAPLGLYLGTNRGQLFASADAGDTWRQIADVGASVRVVRLSAS